MSKLSFELRPSWEGTKNDPTPANYATAFKSWLWDNFKRDVDVIDVTDTPADSPNAGVPYASYFAVRADLYKVRAELGAATATAHDAKRDYELCAMDRDNLTAERNQAVTQRDDARANIDDLITAQSESDKLQKIASDYENTNWQYMKENARLIKLNGEWGAESIKLGNDNARLNADLERVRGMLASDLKVMTEAHEIVTKQAAKLIKYRDMYERAIKDWATQHNLVAEWAEAYELLAGRHRSVLAKQYATEEDKDPAYRRLWVTALEDKGKTFAWACAWFVIAVGMGVIAYIK